MPTATRSTLAVRTPLADTLAASAADVQKAASTPGSMRPDFEVFTGPMATYGLLDPLTKAVTPVADLVGGKYPHVADLARFALKMAAGQLSNADIEDLLAIPAPVVRMTGSSSVQDLEGDVMAPTSLDDMTRPEADLTIFRDHSYSLPDDVVGRLIGMPWLQIQGGITDLWLQAAIAIRQLNALRIYNLIADGGRIGVSGGFMVLESLWIDRKTGKPVDNQAGVTFEDVLNGLVSLQIVHTKAVEWSTVGIPANQRSWVGGAAKGLFARTGHPLLAPIARGYAPDPRDWHRLLRAANVTDEARRDLEDLPPRRSIAPSGAVLYSFPDEGGQGWGYRAKTGKNWRDLSRGEVAQLLMRSVESIETRAVEPELTKGATGKADWPLAERDRAWDAGEAHKRIAAWAGYEPGGDGFSVAKMKATHFWSPPGDDAHDISKYKLLFCDVVQDKVMAIPRAIFACTGAHGVDAADIPAAEKDAIRGKIERYYARMRSTFGDDTLYPSWQTRSGATGDGGGKAVTEETVTTKAASKTEKAEAKAASGDVAIAEDGTHAAFTGTHTHAHKAMGAQGGDALHEHEHSHDGDANHGHQHEKAGEPDATKSVDGDSAVAATDLTTKAPAAVLDGDTAILPSLPKMCKNCEKGVPSGHTSMKCASCGHCLNCAYGPLPASAMKCAGCGVKLSLEPDEEESVASKGKTVEPDAVKDAEPIDRPNFFGAKAAPLDVDTNVSGAQRQALLASYNSLGALLGFAPVTADAQPDTAKAALVASAEDAQRVVTLISQIDGYVDALCRVNVYGLDGCVDELMRLTGVRDLDDDAEGEEREAEEAAEGNMPAPTPSATSPYYAMSGARVDRTKEGRRNSRTDFADMQTIHDSIMRLTDGAVCKGMNLQEQGDRTPPQGGAGNSEEDAREMDDGTADKMRADTHNERASRAVTVELAKALGDFTGSIKGFDLPQLSKQIETMRETAERAASAFLAQEQQQKALAESTAALRASQGALHKNQGALHEHQQWLAGQLDALANVPLGRPTAMARSVKLDDLDEAARAGVATYDEMARVNADNALAAKGIVPGAADLTLEAALALTTIKSVDGKEYRVWPKGLVPAGGRPDLHSWAKITMSLDEMLAYRAGEEALVPTANEAIAAS